MTYDAFLFFNELEVLEVRLHELNEVVDRFVLVEATRTFTSRPKPLYFQENRAAFAAFEKKIIHVVVEDSSRSTDPWRIQDFQRDCIARGLKQCLPDDIVMVSDVDEIPSAEKVREAVRSLRFRPGPAAWLWHRLFVQKPVPLVFKSLFKKWQPFVRVFEQRMRRFYFNGRPEGPGRWWGTRMAHYRDVGSPNDLRCWWGTVIPNGGWHFTYLGGVERIRTKLVSVSRQDFNTPEYLDPRRLAEDLEKGRNFIKPGQMIEYEPLDATYPAYLLQNEARFAALIHPADYSPAPGC